MEDSADGLRGYYKQRVFERMEFMGVCAVCGKDMLKEDLYECEICHELVCPDCILVKKQFEEDLGQDICKICMMEDDSYAD